MSKTLVLIRHGHRDTSLRERDNSLSEKGQRQAQWIKKFFAARFDEETQAQAVIIASPKVRCVQTLEPLAQHLGRPVQVRPELDEASGHLDPLNDRVEKFLVEWQRSTAALTVACSHGDWLPIAIYNLISLHIDSRKGSWLEVESFNGQAILGWSVPSFKAFYG